MPRRPLRAATTATGAPDVRASWGVSITTGWIIGDPPHGLVVSHAGLGESPILAAPPLAADHGDDPLLSGLCDPVRELIAQTDRLPSPPALFQQIVAMLESDRWTIDGVAETLSTDVALTTEILRVVNSAQFGFFGDVTSVGRAVSLLGIGLIRTLVLGNQLFLPHDELESWLDLDQLDRRCKSVASGAHALALRDNASSTDAGAAYLAGMVNEVGLLVMARVPAIGTTMAAPLNTRAFLDVEQALFGGDRFSVGCHLLRLWGFNADVVQAIGQLRSPDVARARGLPWYLFAARRLVLDAGFTPLDLASPPGANPALDSALHAVRQGAEIERQDDLGENDQGVSISWTGDRAGR